MHRRHRGWQHHHRRREGAAAAEVPRLRPPSAAAELVERLRGVVGAEGDPVGRAAAPSAPRVHHSPEAVRRRAGARVEAIDEDPCRVPAAAIAARSARRTNRHVQLPSGPHAWLGRWAGPDHDAPIQHFQAQNGFLHAAVNLERRCQRIEVLRGSRPCAHLSGRKRGARDGAEENQGRSVPAPGRKDEEGHAVGCREGHLGAGVNR
mmetsp:Transcript_10899/g.31251  ORF Transcript_10899/g.31251 Transcript_10899/m.31251 type:complete len:206 (+) Transcript_10899:765-1382(+)